MKQITNTFHDKSERVREITQETKEKTTVNTETTCSEEVQVREMMDYFLDCQITKRSATEAPTLKVAGTRFLVSSFHNSLKT